MHYVGAKNCKNTQHIFLFFFSLLYFCVLNHSDHPLSSPTCIKSSNLTMAKSVSITHGGESECRLEYNLGYTDPNPDLLSSVAELNGRVFDTDPVISYMLLDLPRKERLAYLPTYWSTLIKSALLNDALITEADGWKAASVLVPPGRYLDNAWTLLCAGFLGVLWRIGFPGFKVWNFFIRRSRCRCNHYLASLD